MTSMSALPRGAYCCVIPLIERQLLSLGLEADHGIAQPGYRDLPVHSVWEMRQRLLLPSVCRPDKGTVGKDSACTQRHRSTCRAPGFGSVCCMTR